MSNNTRGHHLTRSTTRLQRTSRGGPVRWPAVHPTFLRRGSLRMHRARDHTPHSLVARGLITSVARYLGSFVPHALCSRGRRHGQALGATEASYYFSLNK